MTGRYILEYFQSGDAAVILNGRAGCGWRVPDGAEVGRIFVHKYLTSG
jgi:hypothetical protein